VPVRVIRDIRGAFLCFFSCPRFKIFRPLFNLAWTVRAFEPSGPALDSRFRLCRPLVQWRIAKRAAVSAIAMTPPPNVRNSTFRAAPHPRPFSREGEKGDGDAQVGNLRYGRSPATGEGREALRKPKQTQGSVVPARRRSSSLKPQVSGLLL